MKLRYEIEDGYVGPSRPQSAGNVENVLWDLEDDATDSQIANALETQAYETARDNLSVCILNHDEAITEVRRLLNERKGKGE